MFNKIWYGTIAVNFVSVKVSNNKYLPHIKEAGIESSRSKGSSKISLIHAKCYCTTLYNKRKREENLVMNALHFYTSVEV